jgi:transposase
MLPTRTTPSPDALTVDSLDVEEGLQIADVDHLPVIGRIWDELGLTAVVDASVPQDPQQAMSTGLALKAMVLNVVTGRDPLYRLRSWAEELPLEVLLGGGVQPDHFNDSSVARHLDRFFAAGPEKIFNAAALRAIDVEGLSLDRLHNDTTSRLVFGAYNHPEEPDTISITFGHSKDQRPDLKQVMIGLSTTTDGVPVSAQMLSGNTSDKTWNSEMLGALKANLRLDSTTRLHYVGDSALVTQRNLDLAAANGIILTSRMPRTLVATETALVRAAHEPLPMKPLGTFSETKGATSYEGCVLPDCEVLGHRVQLGVYRATPANARTQQVVLARQKNDLVAATKAAKKLSSTRFACEPDAHAAAAEFIAAHSTGAEADRLISLTAKVVPIEIPGSRGRGRPAKNAPLPATTTEYCVEVEVAADERQAEAVMLREGAFVLVHTGREPVSAADMLRAYKGQSVVETRFPFLKDPAWADVFFLKLPHRVEALGYVLLLALLVWSIWERRIRANLRQQPERRFRDWNGMVRKNPTAMVCTHMLSGLKMIRMRTAQGWSSWTLAGRLKPGQEYVLQLSRRVQSSRPDAVTENQRVLA